MMTLGFCTLDIEKDKDFIKNMKSTCGMDLNIIPKIGYTSICKAYNEILDESDDDLIILCHNDIKMHTKDWGKIIKSLFDNHSKYGIIGNVGSNAWSGDSWMGKGGKPLGVLRQFTKYNCIIGVSPKWCLFSPAFRCNDIVSAVTVDGMFMAIKKNRIKEHFDENLTAFHFYDVMFTVDNLMKGVGVGVTYKLDISHYSDGIQDNKWQDAHRYSIEKYGENISYGIKLPDGGQPVIHKYISNNELETFKKRIGYE